jgi:hypothetical protein
VKPDPSGKALLSWSITNNSKLAVYVYDFFLWGPTAWVERSDNRIMLSTPPTKEEATCPPNRFPPVLLLVVAPGRTIHGDFVDSRLKVPPNADLSMRVAVGIILTRWLMRRSGSLTATASTVPMAPSCAGEPSSTATPSMFRSGLAACGWGKVGQPDLRDFFALRREIAQIRLVWSPILPSPY